MSVYSDFIECCEVHNTVREGYSNGEPTATVDLMVAWEDRHELVADIVGNRLVWPHGFINGIRPYALSATIRPFEARPSTDGQGLVYPSAIVTVTYGIKQGDDPEDAYSESLEPTAEFLTLDHRQFRWVNEDGDPLEENEAPGRLLRGLTLRRTLYRVATIPDIVFDAVGHVNAGTYTSQRLGKTFPAETLLYVPPSLNRTLKTDGTGFEFTLALGFQFKPQGWNRFWRASSQQYEAIYDTISQQEYKNYPLADFQALLF